MAASRQHRNGAHQRMASAAYIKYQSIASGMALNINNAAASASNSNIYHRDIRRKHRVASRNQWRKRWLASAWRGIGVSTSMAA